MTTDDLKYYAFSALVYSAAILASIALSYAALGEWARFLVS